MAEPGDELLAAATAALREHASEGDAPVETTRRRVLASVGERPRPRRWRVGLTVFAFALSGATLSWAAATGRLDAALERMGVRTAPSRPARDDGQAPAPTASGPTRIALAAAPEPSAPTPAPEASPPTPDAPAPTLGAPAPKAPAPRPHRRATPTPRDPTADLAAYRQAHALHFRGGAPTAALAAWDAYLAAHPAGQFVAEARYNRAIALVRLDRIVDARAALAPFAEGRVEGGYRQREATELRAALAGRP